MHKQRTVGLHLLVTFNGTTQVPLAVLDGSTGSPLMACTMDLTARRLVDSSCH